MYTVRQLADDLYAFEEGTRVRSFLLIGSEKALQVDTGNGLVDFGKEIPLLTDLPVILVNSHGDRDHVCHNECFPKRFCHKDDFALIKRNRPFPEEEYSFVDDGDKIDIGNYVFEVIHVPGHTMGSIVLYDKEHKIMFGGDTLTSIDTFMFGPATNREAMKGGFEKLMALDLDVELLLTCHDGCPIYNYKDLLHDTYMALCDYLDGKPETELFRLTKGAHDKIVKRYAYGCASILPEVVQEVID